MKRGPVAYIRRSSQSRSDPGDTSRDFQTSTVRALAANDANLVILDGDWGISASRESTAKRLAFLELLRAVEAGEVSTLYAYSTDRLARSVRWAAQLLDACEMAGTTIVTSEGRFEPGSDMARTMFLFQAVNNENYSRQQKTKRAASIVSHKERGIKMGQPFYGKLPGEDLPAVLAAFDEAGSYMGATRLLNHRGVPSRRGHWGSSSVHRIVVRERGRMTTVRGAKVRADHIFHRLLRCHCGRTLTGSRRSDGTTVYRCIRAEADVDHGKQSVAERPILEWAVGEMARLRAPEAVRMVDADAEMAELRAKVERIRVAFVAGLMDEATMLADKAAVDAAITRLDLQGRAVRVPAFSWDHGPRDLNVALRSLWDHVELGPDLRPVRADWLLPESWLAEPTPE